MLDPIVSVVKGDSHKNAETRLGLQPFCDLCAATGAAGLGVHHFTKNTAGGDPLDRISGSLAFGALPPLHFGGDARSKRRRGPTPRAHAG